MPDSIECFDTAARLLKDAERTDNPNKQETFIDLARQWKELGTAQADAEIQKTVAALGDHHTHPMQGHGGTHTGPPIAPHVHETQAFDDGSAYTGPAVPQ